MKFHGSLVHAGTSGGTVNQNTYTGADLYNLCQCAVVNSMKRAGDLHLEFNSKGNFLITFKDFEEALKSDFT